MRIVLYTCVFGLYDKIPEHRLLPDIELVTLMINDTELNKQEASRYYKMLPHLIPGFNDYDVSIYADGNFEVIDPVKLQNLCETLYNLPQSSIFFRHPDRQTPNQELKEVVRRGLVSEIEGSAAEKRMFDNGFDGKQRTLTENGFMIRKHHDPELQKAELFWWCEYMHGPRRDQISLQYAMFKTGYENYLLYPCAEKLSMVKIKRHGE